MNVAEWIIVAILSMTLLVFLILGIVLIVRLLDVSKEVKKVVVDSQDVVKNTNGIVANVRGMTSFGGTMEMFIDKYLNPKLKEKFKEKTKERSENGRKSGEK